MSQEDICVSIYSGGRRETCVRTNEIERGIKISIHVSRTDLKAQCT